MKGILCVPFTVHRSLQSVLMEISISWKKSWLQSFPGAFGKIKQRLGHLFTP